LPFRFDGLEIEFGHGFEKLTLLAEL